MFDPLEMLTVKLKVMKITAEKYFGGDDLLFNQTLDIAWEEASQQMRGMLGAYKPADPLPDGVIPTVVNWAAASVIETIRATNPALFTFTTYLSEGTTTRRFGLRGAPEGLDPVAELKRIPRDLIARYRKLC